MIEHYFMCPYCGAEVSMLLDPSIANQRYIEDCEVCCNPIEIEFAVEFDEVISFNANSIEQ